MKQDIGVEFDEEALAEMIETIKLAWIGNYGQYIKVEVQERKYLTRKDRKKDDIEIEAANRIMEEKIKDNISMWHINVMQYTTAITLLERHGKLREKRSRKVERKEPGWIINITNRITAIRRKISYVNLISKCKLDGKYTPKQKFIQKKLTPIYGSTTNTRLTEAETILKHELSVQSKILKDKKMITERQRINSLFHSSPKSVYRGFRKDGKIDVEKAPPAGEVKSFWENIWSRRGTFNNESEWLKEVRNGYCKDVRTKITDIKFEHFVGINENLKDNNSPGIDLITGYWIKRSQATRETTFNIFKKINNREDTIPRLTTTCMDN